MYIMASDHHHWCPWETMHNLGFHEELIYRDYTNAIIDLCILFAMNGMGILCLISGIKRGT